MNVERGEIKERREGERTLLGLVPTKTLEQAIAELGAVPVSDVVRQQVETGQEVLNRRERRGQGWRCEIRFFNDKQQVRCRHGGHSRPRGVERGCDGGASQ